VLYTAHIVTRTCESTQEPVKHVVVRNLAWRWIGPGESREDGEADEAGERAAQPLGATAEESEAWQAANDTAQFCFPDIEQDDPTGSFSFVQTDSSGNRMTGFVRRCVPPSPVLSLATEALDASKDHVAGEAQAETYVPEVTGEVEPTAEVHKENQVEEQQRGLGDAPRGALGANNLGEGSSEAVAICLVSPLRWFRTFAALLAHLEAILLPQLAQPFAMQPQQMSQSAEGQRALRFFSTFRSLLNQPIARLHSLSPPPTDPQASLLQHRRAHQNTVRVPPPKLTRVHSDCDTAISLFMVLQPRLEITRLGSVSDGDEAGSDRSRGEHWQNEGGTMPATEPCDPEDEVASESSIGTISNIDTNSGNGTQRFERSSSLLMEGRDLWKDPHEEVPFATLVQRVPSPVLLELLAALLRERRLIFVSSDLSTLTQAMEAVYAMCYPLQWQHAFLPVLPLKFLPYVMAPFPFLIGLPRSFVPKVQEDDMFDIEQVVVVDLDAGTLSAPMDFIEDDALLPHEPAVNLLSDIAAALHSARSSRELDTLASKAFRRFFVVVLGGYVWHQTTRSALGHGSLYIRHAMESWLRVSATASFTECLLEGQMFDHFLQRLTQTPGDPQESFYGLDVWDAEVTAETRRPVVRVSLQVLDAPAIADTDVDEKTTSWNVGVRLWISEISLHGEDSSPQRSASSPVLSDYAEEEACRAADIRRSQTAQMEAYREVEDALPPQESLEPTPDVNTPDNGDDMNHRLSKGFDSLFSRLVNPKKAKKADSEPVEAIGVKEPALPQSTEQTASTSSSRFSLFRRSSTTGPENDRDDTIAGVVAHQEHAKVNASALRLSFDSLALSDDEGTPRNIKNSPMSPTIPEGSSTAATGMENGAGIDDMLGEEGLLESLWESEDSLTVAAKKIKVALEPVDLGDENFLRCRIGIVYCEGRLVKTRRQSLQPTSWIDRFKRQSSVQTDPDAPVHLHCRCSLVLWESVTPNSDNFKVELQCLTAPTGTQNTGPTLEKFVLGPNLDYYANADEVKSPGEGSEATGAAAEGNPPGASFGFTVASRSAQERRRPFAPAASSSSPSLCFIASSEVERRTWMQTLNVLARL